jgi:hypothetical protein
VVDSVGTQSSGLSGTGGAAADFTVTASPDSQIVSAGNTAAYTVTVDSAGGTFTQAVALTATGLPPGATATFSPVQVTPGSAGAMSTMTVQTSVLSALAHSPAAPFAPMIAVFSCLPLCLRKRTSSRLRAVLGLIIIAGTMQGCGGGFALPGTSAQSENYTITVTGTSGTIQHSISKLETPDWRVARARKKLAFFRLKHPGRLCQRKPAHTRGRELIACVGA